MRYTYDQYNAIIADVERTIKEAESTRTSPDTAGRCVPFICKDTDCSFCPFTHGDNECADIEMYYRQDIFDTDRTADEWQSWLEEFMACNDPGRPYTVEIPSDVVDVIDTALHIKTLDSDTRDLLHLIQKQINDQNRD